MTVEEKYRTYFPSNEIPHDAYNIIKYFDRNKYTHSDKHEELVDLRNIIGSSNERYDNYQFRWIDISMHLKRIDNSDFKPGKIEKILSEYDTYNIDISRLEGTDEYFITWEGHHRITLWKLSGMLSKVLPVSIARLRSNF